MGWILNREFALPVGSLPTWIPNCKANNASSFVSLYGVSKNYHSISPREDITHSRRGLATTATLEQNQGMWTTQRELHDG